MMQDIIVWMVLSLIIGYTSRSIYKKVAAVKLQPVSSGCGSGCQGCPMNQKATVKLAKKNGCCD